MKIAKSITDPRVNRHIRAFLRRRLHSAVGFAILACLTASNSSRAGQPVFITTPPAISPVATSTQAQGPLRASADLNQAAMSQIINQLNQRQFQLSVTVTRARTSAQRSVFVPQKITIKHTKPSAEREGTLRNPLVALLTQIEVWLYHHLPSKPFGTIHLLTDLARVFQRRSVLL